MSVRICALSVPKFYDGEIKVGDGWTEFKKFTDEQRATLVEHVGRFIRIHDEDVKNLAEFGLELVDGKLIETTTKRKTGKAGKD